MIVKTTSPIDELKVTVKEKIYNRKNRPQSSPEREYSRSGHGIIITSIPKSGTHLGEQLVKLLGSHRPYRCPNLIQYYGWPPQDKSKVQDKLEDVEKSILNLKGCQHLLTHMTPEPALVEAIKKQNVRVIFMYRDPRAIVISNVDQILRNTASKFYPFFSSISKDECIDLYIRGAKSRKVDFPNYWLPNIREHFDKFMKWQEVDNCICIKFEDLIGIQGGGGEHVQHQTIKNILEHLEYPYDQEIFEKCVNSVYSKKSPTFNKGHVNAWKNKFPSHHVETFEKIVGNLVEELGYS